MARLKLTHEIIQRSAELIAAGNYHKTVCEYLGIDKSTWYRWLQYGEKAKNGIFRDFYNAIKRAEAEAVARNVAIIQRAAQDSWQAAAWWLERKYPNEWGRKDYVDMSTDGTITIRIVEVGDGDRGQGDRQDLGVPEKEQMED